MIYKAICKKCNNDLLQVYFTEDFLGARCPNCKLVAFNIKNDTLMQIHRENMSLDSSIVHIRRKKETRYKSTLPPRAD